MKLTYTMLITLLVTADLFSQSFKSRELKTEINEVTVFLNGAQVIESGSLLVPAGKSIITIKNLSPYVDEKSIQVKSAGEFTILSVNHRLNYLSELTRDHKIDSLKGLMDDIDLSTAQLNGRLEVIKEKISLLDNNKDLGGQNAGVTMAQLKLAIEFYETEILKMKEEEIRIKRSLESKRKKKSNLEQQLRTLHATKPLPGSEVDIRVDATTPVNAHFSLSYLVGHAGWYPKYDVRVKDVASPLELTYKAEVFQNTGVNWKNVKLRFSNADPNQSGVFPQIQPWLLNYARYTKVDYSHGRPALARNISGIVTSREDGEPLPGVNVVVKGTTVGTVTDVNGNYNLAVPSNASELVYTFIGLTTEVASIGQQSVIDMKLGLDVAQLSEVVVTGHGMEREQKSLGYSQAIDGGRALQGRTPGVQIRGTSTYTPDDDVIIPTTFTENQTTVEIEVATPYSIQSNGEKLLVDLKKYEIGAAYEYFVSPKLDKDAFLIAQIINWDQYNLLEGEANLYFEDAYVGRTVLEARSMRDTLGISLGRDKSIVIGREKNEQFVRRRAIGSNVLETRGFKITIRNKKSQPIKITLFDQIPVSVMSDIMVNPIELSAGKLTDDGKVTWILNIDPKQQKEFKLQYEVKYPKRERVLLE